jgi:type IV secretory pathway protease TraF
VAIRPPAPLATFLDLNGYLPIGVPMLKRILAVPEQTVCRTGLSQLPSTASRSGKRASAMAVADRCLSGRDAASLPPTKSLS